MHSKARCNFCTLKNIRIRAKRARSKVVLVSEQSGVSVYVVPKNEKLNLKARRKDQPAKQFKAWFMDISDHCMC